MLENVNECLNASSKVYLFKHRKNCECRHHHSVFKGHNVIVRIVVLNCQKCNQCLIMSCDHEL